MSRSGLRQLMTTQQMKIQASYLAKYEQVGTLAYSYNLELCLSHIYTIFIPLFIPYLNRSVVQASQALPHLCSLESCRLLRPAYTLRSQTTLQSRFPPSAL